MRKWLIPGFIVVCGGLYVASPFWAAWSLREALRSGDTATIEQRVQWQSVRSSLKASLATNAQLLSQANDAGAAIRPTMWQRVKSAFGATMLDRFIETYVTPEGLPQLFRYNQLARRHLPGRPSVEELDSRPWTERAVDFYSRLRRAEFRSLTRVELEIGDRFAPERHFVSVMELVSFRWKLTEIHVMTNETTLAALP